MDRLIRKEFVCHRADENFLNETLFHNANGYIGVRGSLSEGVPQGFNSMRGMYVNGFYDIIPMKQAENLCNMVNEKETMLNVSDTMTITLDIDGECFDMTKGNLVAHTRTLDMNRGVTLREVIWETESGKRIELTETRMTSFVMPSLFSMEYKVRAVNFTGKVSIRSYHLQDVTNYCDPTDPRIASESRKNLNPVSMEQIGDVTVAVSETFVSKLNLCVAVRNELDTGALSDRFSVNTECHETDAVFTAEGILREGESMRLLKYSIFTDSIRESNLKNAAVRLMDEVVSKGLPYYYDAQEKYLTRFWNHSAMEVRGDDALNQAVMFNMYELLQSAPKDEYCSMAAKGMSGEGYEGHYFWDTEIFVLPYLTMTAPEVAKTVLEYRFSTLDKARENARLLGHRKGALYPWRTITGTECSGYFVSGTAAYHIDADVAYAVVKYYQTTGDLLFIEEKGEEILLETARLFLDTGNYDRSGRFVINEVTGPDEYTCMTDNNYYTNCAAKYNLEWAVKLYRILESQGKAKRIVEKLGLSEAELGEMEDAANKMLLLYDENLGINPQDDSFLNKPVWDFENTPKENYPLLLHYHPLHLYRYQVCKQADTVLAHFMFEKNQTDEVMKRSFRYYEKITTHDSSLSTCVFSIMASRLGFREDAYRYFGDSAKMDLENTHHNAELGIHTANMGGCYMAIVNGFSGIRIDESGISISPSLPDRWESLTFNFLYMGRHLRVTATQKDATVEMIAGDELKVTLYGHESVLTTAGKLTATAN